MEKKEYISRLAKFLIDNNINMNAVDLASHLNWNNYSTNYKTPYKGKRGIYRLIHSVYDWLFKNNKIIEAEYVAKAFKKPDGVMPMTGKLICSAWF